jgi:hypothetical protein
MVRKNELPPYSELVLQPARHGGNSITMRVKAAGLPKTSVSIYESTRCQIQEVHIL